MNRESARNHTSEEPGVRRFVVFKGNVSVPSFLLNEVADAVHRGIGSGCAAVKMEKICDHPLEDQDFVLVNHFYPLSESGKPHRT